MEIINQFTKGMVTVLDDDILPATTRLYVHNIAVGTADGLLRPIPKDFRSKKEGLWYYDGQFFWLK